MPGVLSRKGERWPGLTNPGSHPPSSWLVQSETRLSHSQNQQYSQIHFGKFMPFYVFNQKHTNTHKLSHSPQILHLSSFSVAYWLRVHFVLTSWLCYYGLMIRQVQQESGKPQPAHFSNETNSAVHAGLWRGLRGAMACTVIKSAPGCNN